MKKWLMIILAMAFALNLFAVIVMIGECMTPRQVFYTMSDAVMNSAYRFRRGWQAGTFAP